MTDKRKLTEKQQLVYDSIVDYQMQNGYAPSIRELCVICNLASTSTVYAHLKKLEEYKNEGIVLGDNLIITMESGSMPLSTRNIDKIIECLFLKKDRR